MWSRCNEPLIKNVCKNALLCLSQALVSIDDIQHLSLDNALFDPLLQKLFLSFKLFVSRLTVPPFPVRVIA